MVPFYDLQAKILRDKAYHGFFLKDDSGKLWPGHSSGGEAGAIWDFRNASARTYLAQNVAGFFANASGVDGVFFDEGDSLACHYNCKSSNSCKTMPNASAWQCAPTPAQVTAPLLLAATLLHVERQFCMLISSSAQGGRAGGLETGGRDDGQQGQARGDLLAELLQQVHTLPYEDQELPLPGANNASSLRRLVPKMIILPRQARDKHRESSKNRDAFFALQEDAAFAIMNSSALARRGWMRFYEYFGAPVSRGQDPVL